ncbi:MAG: hypothetical protein CVU95_13075 [Firmicutes bacterium HGW-Firmicutes-2]|jgi:hypothetical protein|uniref:Uncharacterized protein n=1 Tax=Petrocella atlantisensis TaxID=2173034 RepID=A0A3P7S386_9FIRM|nr:MAG: hypothetical protein CVU95_13075 [Firmicutes bacterium HGW-Firmicutes-2]VDN47209.1 conserved protein of unknown function [Petrocella atlantisensis]
MIKKKLKIVNYCLMAFIAFTGKTMVTEAAEIPIAGIDLVLHFPMRRLKLLQQVIHLSVRRWS